MIVNVKKLKILILPFLFWTLLPIISETSMALGSFTSFGFSVEDSSV